MGYLEFAPGSRLLFFKYAIPCGDTLVKRGLVTSEVLGEMRYMVSQGVEPPKGNEKIFQVGYAMCSVVAMERGRKEIDNEDIRAYFLDRHDAIVERRGAEMGDFDIDDCRTYPGRVLDVSRDGLVLLTPVKDSKRWNSGEGETAKYMRDFVRNPKKGDLLVVHRNTAVEPINEATAAMLLEKKGITKYPKGLLD